jgi:hypothetical protein
MQTERNHCDDEEPAVHGVAPRDRDAPRKLSAMTWPTTIKNTKATIVPRIISTR